ncbi:MAG: FN3 associated domain-containing protein [Pirellulaceae bacterium]
MAKQVGVANRRDRDRRWPQGCLIRCARGTIRYTTNGSEPRDGTLYTEPFDIEDGDVLVLPFAEID